MPTSWVTLLAISIASGCVAGDPEVGGQFECSEGQCDHSTEAMCSWNVSGRGAIDIETKYLPRVIACENPSVGPEALKAQAIAARSYVYYVARVEKRAIKDGQGDQVFTCGREPSAEIIAAVQATSGQILTYKRSYVAAFFVAGAKQSAPSCQGGTNDPTRTEKWVTYNSGRSGTSVIQTGLGFKSQRNLANRGSMSQNGSGCLSNTGLTTDKILRFYYGEDIEVTQMRGACVSGGSGPIGEPCVDDAVCTADGGQSECLSWFDVDTNLESGFCSVDCTGSCPTGSMCAELSAGIGTGQCMPESAATNNFCGDIPGTDTKVMRRFGGAPQEVDTICAPPLASAVTCSASGTPGECIDTNEDRCDGTLHTGLCPGGANIRCCTP